MGTPDCCYFGWPSARIIVIKKCCMTSFLQTTQRAFLGKSYSQHHTNNLPAENDFRDFFQSWPCIGPTSERCNWENYLSDLKGSPPLRHHHQFNRSPPSWFPSFILLISFIMCLNPSSAPLGISDSGPYPPTGQIPLPESFFLSRFR